MSCVQHVMTNEINLKFFLHVRRYLQAGNYMFKVNSRNTKTRCEICSKLTIKTAERRHLYPHQKKIHQKTLRMFSDGRDGVVLVSLLLTLNIFHTVF